MSLLEVGTILLVALLLGGALFAVAAAVHSIGQARNGGAQATNLSLATLNDLFNECLNRHRRDQVHIEALTGTISRAANFLREASGDHRRDDELCPLFERHQLRIDRTIIALEEAIENDKSSMP